MQLFISLNQCENTIADFLAASGITDDELPGKDHMQIRQNDVTQIFRQNGVARRAFRLLGLATRATLFFFRSKLMRLLQ